MKNEKFDVIVGNPMICHCDDGRYNVYYAQPPFFPEVKPVIRKFEGLTLDEVAKLPFVDSRVLNFIK